MQRTFLALIILLALGRAVYAQSSLYLIDPQQVDYSGLGPNGGTIILPLVLSAGDPVPGIGPQFSISVTLSPITALHNPEEVYQWNNTHPMSGAAGPLYPDNVYTLLPSENLRSLPTTLNGISLEDDPDGWWQEALEVSEMIVYLGTFSMTVGAFPNVPGYAVDPENTLYAWEPLGNVIVDGDEATRGYRPFGPLNIDFGQTHEFRFTAFAESDFSQPPGQFFWIQAYVTYAAIPEPETATLLLAAGAIAIRKGCKIRHENLFIQL